MPKIALSPTDPTNDAIAAAARDYLEFSLSEGSYQTRFSFGSTYTEADSQLLSPGDVRIFEGDLADQAISFGPCQRGAVDVTTL